MSIPFGGESDMSERRDAIVKALKKAGIQNPTDDDIDTAANQLDSVIPSQSAPTDADADIAVQRGEQCKSRLVEKQACKAAERELLKAEYDRVRAERKKSSDKPK